MKKTVTLISIAVMLVLVASTVFAEGQSEDWPTKPISVYVGWTAGGTSDKSTRFLVREMEDFLDVQIQVVNVEGANGGIGGTRVGTEPPDGYSWFGGGSVHGTWPVMNQSKSGWTDFYTLLSITAPQTMYVRADAPWQTITEFIEDIREQPGKFRYGIAGVGSAGDLLTGSLLEMADAAGMAEVIPYAGGRQAAQFLLSGAVDAALTSMGDVRDWVISGELRPLINFWQESIEFAGKTYEPITDYYPEMKPYNAVSPFYGISVRRDTPEYILVKITEAFLYAVDQQRFYDSAVTGLSAVLAVRLGQASDEAMSLIESARAYPLFKLGKAPNDPVKLGIPRITEWSWPPHDRAVAANPWPDAVIDLWEQWERQH